MKTFKKNIYNVKYTSVLDGISLKMKNGQAKLKNLLLKIK